MFDPSRFKFRKAFKGRVKGNVSSGSIPSFGTYALKALEPCRIQGKHIEAVRKSIVRTLKRKGRLWIRVYPNVPVTKRPADVRMGKGKGSTEYWVFRVKPGRILFELEGVTQDQADEAFIKASLKLPFKCKMVVNKIGGLE